MDGIKNIIAFIFISRTYQLTYHELRTKIDNMKTKLISWLYGTLAEFVIRCSRLFGNLDLHRPTPPRAGFWGVMSIIKEKLEKFGLIRLIVKPASCKNPDDRDSRYILTIQTPPKGWRWF